MKRIHRLGCRLLLFLTIAGSFAADDLSQLPEGVTRVPVVFSGGHDIDRQHDHGRPVVLIAAALGVEPDVFRQAFSGVHPAGPGKGPTPDEARQNKKALMDVLGKYDITNDRLDAVSNYYRFVPQLGELWTNTPAEAYALVKEGKVTGYEIIKAGAGYSSAPAVSVPGLKVEAPKVELAFGKDLKKNGSVSAISAGSTFK